MSAEDYFPFKENRRYTYNFKSSEFNGTATVHIDILNSEKKDERICANALMTFVLRDAVSTRFEIINDGEWIYSTNGIVTGGRKELPVHPEKTSEWTEAPDSCRIQSLDEECETPAGKFASCMKINVLISDGAGGSSERWYAPGTGLVKEIYNAEDKQCELELVSCSNINEQLRKIPNSTSPLVGEDERRGV